MVWIHYSSNSIEKLLDDDSCFYQYSTVKPFGLWLSKNTEWLEWMKSEMPEWIDDVKYIYKISLKKNSNILKISNKKQLDIFNEKYKDKNNEKFINWKKVCQDYDGVFFDNYNDIKMKLLSTTYTDENKFKYVLNKYYWYFMIDVSSMCIFRPNKILSKITLIEKL